MRFFRWFAAALILGVAAFVMMGSAPSSAAPTCTKTLVTSGLWTTASSWSPAAVPTASDYACIPAGLTATLNAARTVDGVSIQGQLSGTGTLSVSDAGVASPSELGGTVSIAAFRILVGSLAVDSAMMDGSGTTTVASGASMSVRNADFYGLFLSGTRSLVNNGTVTLVEEVGTPVPVAAAQRRRHVGDQQRDPGPAGRCRHHRLRSPARPRRRGAALEHRRRGLHGQ